MLDTGCETDMLDIGYGIHWYNVYLGVGFVWLVI